MGNGKCEIELKKDVKCGKKKECLFGGNDTINRQIKMDLHLFIAIYHFVGRLLFRCYLVCCKMLSGVQQVAHLSFSKYYLHAQYKSSESSRIQCSVVVVLLLSVLLSYVKHEFSSFSLLFTANVNRIVYSSSLPFTRRANGKEGARYNERNDPSLPFLCT